MSIFPVNIKESFGDPKSAFYEEKEMLESILPYTFCNKCGDKVTFKRGYVMHSITFGGADGAWCSKKCLEAD